MPRSMSEELKQEILSNVRGAIAVISDRGYSSGGWGVTGSEVNVRRAVGLSALDYPTHIETIKAIGSRLPHGPRGKLFTGITDWETYKDRTQQEVLDMLNGVVADLEAAP